MFMKKAFLIPFAILLIGISISSGLGAYDTISFSSTDYNQFKEIPIKDERNTDHSVSFLSADYGDFDDDGSSDDTEAFMDLTLGFCPKKAGIFKYKLVLILPSRIRFSVSGKVFNFNSDSYVIRFVLVDSVLEPGWYTIRMFTTFVGYGGPPLSKYSEIIFDPPSAQDGGFPS